MLLGAELYQRQRERATARKISSERGQRQRANATQHRARLNFSAFLGFFSARQYSRQGGTVQTQYKRFLTASRLTACKLGTAHGLGKADRNRQPKTSRTATVLPTSRSTEIPRCTRTHERGYCRLICRWLNSRWLFAVGFLA